MNGVVNRENFCLKKVKILKSGGLEVNSVITVSESGAMMEIPINRPNVPIVPAEILTDAIRNLKDYFLKSCALLMMETLVNSFEFKPRKDQKEAVMKAIDILKERTKVTGISVSGDDKTEGVIITGTIKAENGGIITVNSPRIVFSASTLKFEEDLRSECHIIETHVYNYLYKGEKLQIEAFTEGDD